MLEKISGTIPKEENIITLEDMEEEGNTVKQMWLGTVYKHDRVRGS